MRTFPIAGSPALSEGVFRAKFTVFAAKSKHFGLKLWADSLPDVFRFVVLHLDSLEVKLSVKLEVWLTKDAAVMVRLSTISFETIGWVNAFGGLVPTIETSLRVSLLFFSQCLHSHF